MSFVTVNIASTSLRSASIRQPFSRQLHHLPPLQIARLGDKVRHQVLRRLPAVQTWPGFQSRRVRILCAHFVSVADDSPRFAIVVCPVYEDPSDQSSSPFNLQNSDPFTWSWLSTINRVNSQVMKVPQFAETLLKYANSHEP